jgi:sucrose-phosphate synthase
MHIAFLNVHGNFDPEDRYWTAHPDFGGQLVYVKEVTLALARRGHTVDILTRRIRDSQWYGFESDIDHYPGEPNVRIVRLPCNGDQFLRKQDLWPYLGTEWVPNLIDFYATDKMQPDVATAHYADSGLCAALWQSRGGPRYTFTGHSLGAQKLERLLIYNHATLEGLDSEYFFARRIAAERVAASNAARVITSTRQERYQQYSHAAYRGAVDPADDGKFAVIPPGVNLRIFDADVHGRDDTRITERIDTLLRRDIDTGREDLPVVICSSRLEPKKNHIGLVLAFSRSPELQAAANLVLVVRGTKSLRSAMSLEESEQAVMNEIVAACEAHGLWGKVAALSLEGQTELAAAYRHFAKRHSVFALTALYEPFGLAPLEAMAAGLPAVVTQCGGPSESLKDAATGAEYGVLVQPTDPAAIARGLLRLVGPGNRWEYFREAGRQRVLDHYTWGHTATAYADLLEEIVAGPPPAPSGAIPKYFTDPSPENDIGLQELKHVFEKAGSG